MRIALFAADIVGTRIAEFFGKLDESLACLVVDRQDARGRNDHIIAAAGVDPGSIIRTDRSTRRQLASQLREFAPDLCVLAWWPYLLKPDVLRIPTVGCLNFHPSLLPHGRGKAPNFWSLVEQTPFGVTLHWVDEGIDSGDIAFQREIPITWEDTGKTLYQKSLDAMVELFESCWPDIRRGNIPRIRQSEQTICHYQRDLEAASEIDLDGQYFARDMLNKIRARTFEPHPAAWFEDGGRRYQVRISISPVEDQVHDARTIRRA